MPELPEVETILQELHSKLRGRTFTSVTINWPRSIKTPVSELKQNLPGQTIVHMSRRGKYLLFSLSGGETLLLHLKMSGRLYIASDACEPHKHVRTCFGLDDGRELRFKDTRKFGRVYLVDNPSCVIGKLGPEPLSQDMTRANFIFLFEGKRGRLKPLLLNQEFIAGLGNIYSDEICFRARINPSRTVDTLSRDEFTALFKAMKFILNRALQLKGTTLDSVYPGGDFQNHFQVYGRHNEPCHRCTTSIEKIVLGGRSTHFCPTCQV